MTLVGLIALMTCCIISGPAAVSGGQRRVGYGEPLASFLHFKWRENKNGMKDDVPAALTLAYVPVGLPGAAVCCRATICQSRTSNRCCRAGLTRKTALQGWRDTDDAYNYSGVRSDGATRKSAAAIILVQRLSSDDVVSPALPSSFPRKDTLDVSSRQLVTSKGLLHLRGLLLNPKPRNRWCDDNGSIEDLKELEKLRGTYNRNAISAWAARRPMAVSKSLFACARAYFKVKRAWRREESLPAEKRTRGQLLRSELSKLGPFAVKIGQTLSQRPDMIAPDVCEELKGLQMTNTPFPNEVAWKVIADELGWEGPIAPGLPLPPGCSSGDKTLFAALSPAPIASASLGQVYRGTTHEGVEVAIKVQRPTALRQCMLDAAVFIGVLRRVQRFWGNGDMLEIVDTIAAGILQELDFRNEARNAVAFANSLAHLGYVTVPKTLANYSVGPRVMVSEWVYGRHLKELCKEEQLRMCAMLVEAVTAGLVLTGIVHADPHEGNVMLDNHGRLVMLDFGLMSTVENNIMEAFARGIQAVLAKDWTVLVDSFIETGFFGNPIMYRPHKRAMWTPADKSRVTRELEERMERQEGGMSRFGALSKVLFEMSGSYQEFTPPYVLLLIRTFLTLEGVVAHVDPTFNIYEAALPWAVQRALAPSTPRGAQLLRSALLTEQNEVQWQRLEQLIADTTEPPAGAARTARSRATADTSGITGSVTPLDSLRSVMAAPQGAALRRIMRDLDASALFLRLAAPSSRGIRRLAVDALAAAIERPAKSAAPQHWPLSEAGAEVRRRRRGRFASVLLALGAGHARRLVAGGLRGLAALVALVYLALRIGSAALCKALLSRVAAVTLWGRGGRGGRASRCRQTEPEARSPELNPEPGRVAGGVGERARLQTGGGQEEEERAQG